MTKPTTSRTPTLPSPAASRVCFTGVAEEGPFVVGPAVAVVLLPEGDGVAVRDSS